MSPLIQDIRLHLALVALAAFALLAVLGSLFAATGVIDPNGDGTTGGTQDTCGGLGEFDCLDDQDREPTTPNVGGDFVTYANNAQSFYDMEPISGVATATDVTVHVYHAEGAGNMQLEVSLWDTTESTEHSAAPQLLPNDTGGSWASTTFTGVDLTGPELNGMKVRLLCTKTGGGGPSDCTAYAMYATVTYTQQTDVVVESAGSQTATVDIPTGEVYVGGTFVIEDTTGSSSVTSITIAETGSVDAANDLANIELYYDLDTVSPFDCAAESFSGTSTESQFGATDVDGFSAANGTSSFSDSVTIATSSTMCVYAVLDVLSGAQNNDTLDIEITDPSSDVVLASGSVGPDTPVALTGTTTLQKHELNQAHYHFRNDDGPEATSTSKTDGVEDTAVSHVRRNDVIRLRLAVSNDGSTSSPSTRFRLEFGEKITTCNAISQWHDLDTAGDDWRVAETENLTDGANTTNIAESTGGVTDPNTTFLTPNSAVKDAGSQTDPIVLTETQFVELEYAIEATDNAAYGTTYCFRLSDAGSPIATYDVYPEATTRENQDFFIQRGSATIQSGNTTATINAGTEYTAPLSSTTAFIRITNTQLTGAGHNVGGGTQDAENVTVHIQDPSNLEQSVTFTRDNTVNTTRVDWEIVEYIGAPGGDNEITVRNQAVTAFSSGALVASSSVAGVEDAGDVAVFITGQASEHNKSDAYNVLLATADYSGVFGEVVLERGEIAPGNTVVSVSWAAVEFVGPNWNVQRMEHTYTSAVSAETETLPSAVNDLSRAFIHAQKRVGSGANGIDEFGHEVWLSSTNQVSFRLQGTADSPGAHTSVAWVIENTQITGTPMSVTRSNGTQNGGTEPSTVSVPIGVTLADTDVASIFVTNRVSGTDTSFPRPMMAARIASTTHYELWISDTGQTRTYRTEVVAWPTAARRFTQHYYRFYVDNDALDPTDPWPVGGTDLGENTAITENDDPLAQGEIVRVRMSIQIGNSALAASTSQFRLEFGERVSTCGAIASWQAVGGVGSTTALWRGINASPVDGTALSGNPPTAGDLNLSVSDRAGTYEESSPSAANPFKVAIGEDAEYDWILEHNGAADTTTYCFRMTHEDTTTLTEYLFYPTLTTGGFAVTTNHWRWYDDETSLTPTVPLAGTNTAPTDVAQGNTMKLRVNVEESAGGEQPDAKFKLQVSPTSNFSSDVADVADQDSCNDNTFFCFADGAGDEGATITQSTLASTDSCSAGTGDGCGTHNEYSFVPRTIGEVGSTTVDSAGVTVSLAHTYTNPVVIAEAVTGDSAGGSTNRPAAAIITATTSTSFDVRIQEPDNEADDHGSEVVSYIVMERGAHTLPDGTRVDVGTNTISDYYGNAVAGTSDATCTFTQSFSEAPVVLSALQSDNNTGTPDFLTASQLSITSSDFSCSIEVPDGESNAPTSPETYGWIAIERGSFTNNGINFEASTTTQTVTGWTDTPWDSLSFGLEYFSAPPALLASKQTREGAEGGWVRYDVLSAGSVLVAIDERDDGERSHTGEEVGYIAFSESGTLIDDGGTSAFTFPAGAVTEFEFTLTHNSARANTVYFFRLYDVTNDAVVAASTTNPSLTTEGATLSFSITGIESASTTEGITTDLTTTATTVPFGVLAIDAQREGAQRLSVSTNATEGYQVFIFERQNLISGSATIDDISGTNENPLAWSVACAAAAAGCWGYHAGDNTLAGGSTRFLLDDTYAALTSELAEVAYSSGPVTNEQTDIVYKIEVRDDQPAGTYQADLGYVVVPVF